MMFQDLGPIWRLFHLHTVHSTDVQKSLSRPTSQCRPSMEVDFYFPPGSCASLVVRTEASAPAIRPPGRQDAFNGEAFLSWNPGPIRRNPSLIPQFMARSYHVLLQQGGSTHARDGKLRARYFVHMDESCDLHAGFCRDTFCLIAQNIGHSEPQCSPRKDDLTMRRHTKLGMEHEMSYSEESFSAPCC